MAFALGGKAAAVSSGIFRLLDLRSEELEGAAAAGGLEPAEALRLRGGIIGMLDDVEGRSEVSGVDFEAAGAAEVWATRLAA